MVCMAISMKVRKTSLDLPVSGETVQQVVVCSPSSQSEQSNMIKLVGDSLSVLIKVNNCVVKVSRVRAARANPNMVSKCKG